MSQNSDWSDTAGDRLLDVVLKKVVSVSSTPESESSYVFIAVFRRPEDVAPSDLDGLLSEAQTLGVMDSAPREIEFPEGDVRVIAPGFHRAVEVDGLPAAELQTELVDHLADGGTVTGHQVSYYVANADLGYYINGDVDEDGHGEVARVLSSLKLYTP